MELGIIIVFPWLISLLIRMRPANYGVLSLLAVFVLIVGLGIWKEEGYLHRSWILWLDSIILLYTGWVAYRSRSALIALLTLIQVLLLGWIETHQLLPTWLLIRIDPLSFFMLVLSNVIGGLILLYTLRYVHDESDDVATRGRLMALLIFFLGTMNGLVICDHWLAFFAFFELSTLCSFWLIRFRGDPISQSHAERALWINQLGGSALLIAIALSPDPSWSHPQGVLPLVAVSFMSIAALIKGAQFPFSSWLTGAMVAPTPVSAILHSATMVKIAPYMILRLSPSMAGILNDAVGIIGGISFILGGLLALNETHLKSILAYSTIAMLGLMIVSATWSSPLGIVATLVLILFHALSKALLFLGAGILEHRYHIRSIDEPFGAPYLRSMLIFGFLSIALPPFGISIAKWWLYTQGEMLPLLLVIVGSVILSVVYLSTLGSISRHVPPRTIPEDPSYLFIMVLLSLGLIALSIDLSGVMVWMFPIITSLTPLPLMLKVEGLSLYLPFGMWSGWYMVGAMMLWLFIPLISFMFSHLPRTTPYNGAERYPSKRTALHVPIPHTLIRWSALGWILLLILGIWR